MIQNTYPNLSNIVHTDFELGRVMYTVAAADPGITVLSALYKKVIFRLFCESPAQAARRLILLNFAGGGEDLELKLNVATWNAGMDTRISAMVRGGAKHSGHQA